MDNFTSSIYFSHKNTYNRQFIKQQNIDHSHINLEDISINSQYKDPEIQLIKKESELLDKLEIEKFIKFVYPTKRNIFYDILDGHTITEVAKRNGYSRQQIHNIYKKTIVNYKKERDLE